MAYPAATDPRTAPTRKKRSPSETVTFLKTARDRFAQAESSDEKQRARELADLRFYAGDQWDALLQKAREGSGAVGGLPPVPARPCLTINKVREPVHQVLNEERQSDMGIELVAADDFGELVGDHDHTEVDLREGLIRRIQRESQAADARTWAFMRATIAGRGFYGVMTRFLPGLTWDQEIYVHRYYNQASVSLDPAHEQPDGSDAEWGFVGVDMPFEEYRALFPKAADGSRNPVSESTEDQFRALGDEAPTWFSTDGERRSCRVVDYWHTVRETRTLALLPDGSVAWEDELPDGAEPLDTRAVVEKTIKWAKIDGHQVLDETDWPGPDLPIVKVLGEELQPYDTERRAEGMVRPARDAQQGFNAMVSKWVETVGLAPIPALALDPLQIVGYEPWYQLANTRTVPYLPYSRFDAQGREYPPPSATNRDTPVQAIAGSIQVFSEAIQSTTGVESTRSGAIDPTVRSGKAIQLLREQSSHGTSNYMDNLKRSIRYEGQIINNLLYPIYGQRPGRLARIVTSEGESQTIRVNAPGAQPAAGPVPVPMPGQPPITGAAPPKQFTLTKDAHFNVIVKVTRSFDSRRTEEATTIADLLQASPVLMTWYGDLFFKNQDGPGHQEMSERAEVMLDPKIQAMRAAKKGGGDPVPPQVQAQMQHAMEQLKQQGAVLEEMHRVIQSKQIEADETRYKTDKDAETRVKIAEIQFASAANVADIKANLEHSLELMTTQTQTVQGLIEAHQAQLDRAHEAQSQMAAQSHAMMQAQTPPPMDPNQPPPAAGAQA